MKTMVDYGGLWWKAKTDPAQCILSESAFQRMGTSCLSIGQVEIDGSSRAKVVGIISNCEKLP